MIRIRSIWGKLLFAPFLLVSGLCLGHSITISSYELFYENEKWTLIVEQKTRALRDAIYDIKPQLKGKNLNSNQFLESTHQYILSNIVLEYNDEILTLNPIRSNFGGLKFEGVYEVIDLPPNPDKIKITTSGYDDHEHSTIVFSIKISDQGYLNYFNKSKTNALFSFHDRNYQFSTKDSSPGIFTRFQLIIILIAIAIVTIVVIKRKSNFNS